MSKRNRIAVIIAAVIVMSGTLAACQTARVGQRCRGTGFGQTSSLILQCKRGRWRAIMTKAQYVQLLVAIRNSTTTTQPPTTAPATTTQPPTTTTVPAGPQTYALGPAYQHNCAVIAGTVKCIGHNNYGQLGDGTTTDSTTAWVSTGITDATSVAGGSGASCALRQNGTVWCWGYGVDYQLGNGSNANSSVPVQVSGITTATRVVVGPQGGCAVLADATARCWGATPIRGDGVAATATTPTTVALGSISKVAVGINHACAIQTDGTPWCWGFNSSGQLGNGTTTDSLVPVQVTGGFTATDIAAGSNTSCAVRGDGGASCWGADTYNQLGDGDGSTTQRPTPNAVVSLTGAAAIAMNFYSTCARGTSGSVSCWGLGGYLGDGTFTASSTPVAVDGISTADSISAAGRGTCVVLADHTGRCWGTNDYGQLGSGTVGGGSTPLTVTGMP